MTSMAKLVVLAAFDKNDCAGLRSAPGRHGSARGEAELLAGSHAGLVAWSRHAGPRLGEYGQPEMLFQAGDIPNMEYLS